MRQRLILALVVLAALGLAWWAHQRHASGVIDRAVLADRAVWQAEAQRIHAQATQREIDLQTRATIAQMEADHAHAQQIAAVSAAAAGARSERDRLRNTLATLRRGGSQAGQSSSTEPGPDATAPLADALAACADRYADVAGIADELSTQVTGLQAYIAKVVGPVCIAGVAQ